jgi:hypothetical protein
MDAIERTDDLPSESGMNLSARLPAVARKLAVIPPPLPRPRPITNLGRIFGQFADLQQQIAEQVVALEESVEQQRQDVAAALSQLPAMRERINWLMASFYEQSHKDALVREKLDRHDSALAALTDTVRAIHEAQMQWQAAVEEILYRLVDSKKELRP